MLVGQTIIPKHGVNISAVPAELSEESQTITPEIRAATAEMTTAKYSLTESQLCKRRAGSFHAITEFSQRKPEIFDIFHPYSISQCRS